MLNQTKSFARLRQAIPTGWRPIWVLLIAAACGMYALFTQLGNAVGGLPLSTGRADICRGQSGVVPIAGQASSSTQISSQSAFVEEFTGNTGLNRFRRGVYHRGTGSQEIGKDPVIWGDGNALAYHGGNWTGDHDLSCGPPHTQRALSSTAQQTVDFGLDRIFYLCSDHLMSSMGDVDGYSVAWFSPDQQFDQATHNRVSWEVNVTDLGGRQWWEVSIIPVGAKAPATVDWLAKGTAGLSDYHQMALVVGSGPLGSTVNITTNRKNRPMDWRPLCGDYGLDPAGCASKMIRRAFSITDNRDGSVTINYGNFFSKKVPGKFPDKFEVRFEGHGYTPDKDEKPAGYTWHWDNIRIERDTR